MKVLESRQIMGNIKKRKKTRKEMNMERIKKFWEVVKKLQRKGEIKERII
jgi:hypothetical protein